MIPGRLRYVWHAEDFDSMADASLADWTKLVGQQVVLDLAAPYVCLGRLAACDAHTLVLDDADVHDLRDAATTREKYVLQSQLHGVRVNRRRCWISRREVASISRLCDVVVE